MTVVKTIRDRANWLAQVSYVTLNLFLKSKVPNHAAAVAYYALLSLAPLMVLLVYLLNTYLQNYPELREAFGTLVGRAHLDIFSQNPDQIIRAVSSLVGITNGLGILLLLWSSKGLMKSVHNAFAVIFTDSSRRNLILSSLISLMSIPFIFLLLGITVLGDYLLNHFDYAALDLPILGQLLKLFFVSIGLFTPFRGIWSVVFLLYFQMPLIRPEILPTLLYSLLCTLSLYALEAVLTHVVKIDKYITLYGSLGDIIFVLIWVYLACILFFMWAEFLYVAGKIDVVALEKIFLDSEDRSRLEFRIEHFLFNRSGRIFEKYGKHCVKGEMIIRQNDDTGSIYFLYSGQVGLYRENHGKEIRMGGLREGEIFGEMAYLLGERRTATVIAESDCFLFIISPETLESLMGYSSKLSRRIVESLCQRIAKMNKGILAAGFESSTYKHPAFKPEAGTV